jgi:hypothetical protein
LLLAALTIGVIYVPLRGCLPGGSGIIARATALDGTEMCIVQKYNALPEPYTVSFYYRRPGQHWGWFYYDHQDNRWESAAIKLIEGEKIAVVLRGTKEVARFDIASESFRILGSNRALSPAQEWMPDGWKPEDVLPASRNVAKSPMEVGAPNNSPPSYQWK